MATIDKICINCSKSFPFTTTEQDFYRANDYADPKRCRVCRQAYKRKITAGQRPADEECFSCKVGYVRGVETDTDNKCLQCARVIEKSAIQYPVLAHHLRGQADA